MSNKKNKGTPKKFDFRENSNFNVANYPKVQNVFFSTIKPLSLNIIKDTMKAFFCYRHPLF